VGEEMPLKEYLYGMMVRSGNDAANVIAEYVSGSIPTFMQELNDYLKQIGCLNTTFCNPHGLHHPDHKTTAFDMALLTREAMKNPVFREIVSTVRHKRPKTNKRPAAVLVQTNRIIKSGTQYYYPKAIGVKTGYHSRAQNTLVAA